MTTFGYQIPGFRHGSSPDTEMFDHTVAHAQAAETGGFDSVWVMDHFWQLPALGGPDEPILEA
jgi:alkanesulfonate monooxygenase SsuD/methylene tetrahydromethanopterin reductase-like flavin-dependent oxidoreductase (luciferase family)